MSFILRLLHQVPSLLTGFVRSLLPCTLRSSTRIDFSSEDLIVGGNSVHLRDESGLARDRRLVTIDMLPDDVLVEIFDFHVNINHWRWYPLQNTWHTLVHVCRRWRYIMFASPRHLNLRLVYNGHRPMSEVLDVWPVLPVRLVSNVEFLPSRFPHPKSGQWWENKVAALESEHYDRIYEIYILDMTNSRWERFAAAMQKPFPELTLLEIFGDAYGNMVRVLPDSFLGGSAPRLRELSLGSISFPSIPKLLLSANRLVKLCLWDIPDSGYISPDAMATALTVMTRLQSLNLGFRSPRSRPDPPSRPLPPPTRVVLPALTQLMFTGVHEYLEDLLARIDAPLLTYLSIMFFMDLNFDVPQLRRFIGHAEEFKTFDHAMLWIYGDIISLSFHPKNRAGDHPRLLRLDIKCGELNRDLSSLARLCSSSFPLISTLGELEIISPSHDMENTQWLGILDPFIALKNLYLSMGAARRVCDALRELSGERATEVLPALRNLFVRGFPSLQPLQNDMMPFVAARQLSGHPVVIDHWDGQLT